MNTQSEETTKRKTKSENKTSTTNLEHYAQLVSEFSSGKMEERKRVALRSKLVTVYRGKTIDSDERKFLRKLLERERARREINEPNLLILHEIEQEDHSKKCFVKHPNAPKNLKLTLDKECKYYYGPDLGKDGTGRFIVFVPEVIRPEFQVDMPTAVKMVLGHEVHESKLPPERVIWGRLELKQKEFDSWFRFDDDELLSDMPNQEDLTYKF